MTPIRSPGPGPEAVTAQAPVCHTEAECTLMWATARTFLLNYAGYKMQTYTSDFMQTYNPPPYTGYLAAEVNKEPTADGRGYVIAAKFWCTLDTCSPNQWETLDQFNRQVAAAGAAARTSAPQTLVLTLISSDHYQADDGTLVVTDGCAEPAKKIAATIQYAPQLASTDDKVTFPSGRSCAIAYVMR